MSSERDSAISVTSEAVANPKSVVIVVDDLTGNDEPAASKDTSPSIESTEVSHITIPTHTADDINSSSSSIAQSTTVFDVDDGGGRAVKEAANKTYMKLRENICLGAVIAVIGSIILTMIVLFYTRPDISNPFDEMRAMETSDQNMCRTNYTSQVCGTLGIGQLPNFLDQNSAESNLSAIFNITSSSSACANVARAFFCNATYRSCDITLIPSQEECRTLENGVCSNQWAQLQSISSLSDCSLLPPTRSCPSHFRLSGNGACIPLCTEFSQNRDGTTILVSVVTGVISNLANIIGGIIVIIIALFRRDTIFRFPQILIIYTTTTISVTVTVITIGYFAADVFCSDDNLIVAISNPTAYCEIYGFTYQAGILIFSGFWLLFVIHLFLKIVFPLQFHNFDTYKHRTKIHIIEIVIVLLLGILIPAIVVGTVEYSIANFPPTLCSANVEVTFYTLILPTILIQGSGIMLIMFSFVSIHRQKGLFKRSVGKRGCIEFTTPEVKLLLIFLYFTLVMFVYWADFSVSLRNRNSLLSAIFEYISCVNNFSYEGTCDEYREDIYDASFPALRVTAVLMTSLVNISNVVFVLQFRDVKKRLRTLTKRFTKSEIDSKSRDSASASRQDKI